jgi:copper(I)-binding protein
MKSVSPALFVPAVIIALAFVPSVAPVCALRDLTELRASLTTPQAADDIAIKDAWIQEGPPSEKITAAFMVIENKGASDTALVSATTDVARTVELHKMELDNQMMKMRRVSQIPIPANGTAELKPGGYHLMVIGLNKTLKEGDQVSVTLRFAGPIEKIEKTIVVPVKKRVSE